MRRPEMGLDCDGILSDFSEAVLIRIEEHTGKKHSADEIRTWEVFDSLPQYKHLKKPIYDNIKDLNGCRTILPFCDAKEGVARLREVANITIVTSPFTGSATWTSERESWLAKHFSILPEDVIHARKKHRIKFDLFMDDKTEHVDEWRKFHYDQDCLGVIWDKPYNKDCTAARAYNWNDVLRLVAELEIDAH